LCAFSTFKIVIAFDYLKLRKTSTYSFRAKADLERKKEEGLKKNREKNAVLTSKEKDAIREEGIY